VSDVPALSDSLAWRLRKGSNYVTPCHGGKIGAQGISMVELFRMFSNDAAAEAWFVERRDGVA